MADLKRDIKYIDRDFNDLRNSLIEYSKTYFPDTYNDFTETSTGMLFIEMAAYVGDVLSFYLDNQIQETFIQYARQQPNLYKMAYMLGYTPKVTTAASVDIDFYQTVPSILSASVNVPDFNYCLTIPENTPVTSNTDSSIQFIIEDNIDFASSSSSDPTIVSIYEIAGTQPTSFLLKKTRKAISATIQTSEFTFGEAKKFDTRVINAANIIGILDCKDSNDNEWYEVPNLSQENVFDYKKNVSTNDPNYSFDPEVPYILELKQVQKRFISRFQNSGSLQIQFGAGSTGNNTEEIVPNPDNVGAGLPFERTQLTTAFSPVNFMFTDTYGIAPSNTTLTIRYLVGGGVSANADANTLTIVNTDNISFNNPTLANTALANETFASIAADNPLGADGGSDGDDITELRINAQGSFQNQLRTVTPQDYLIRTLSMPSNLGVVAKAHAAPCKVDDYQLGEVPTILDLYVLTFNSNKQLRTASSTLKRNLQTYLAEYRMVNDSIKIRDAFIVNIGVEFDIIVLPNYNNNETLTKCISSITNYFNIDKWSINQPIMLKDLFILLDKVEGVQTVQDVKIKNLVGEVLGYSQYAYDIPGATIKSIVYPSIDPMIFEVKFPNSDIKGRVVPL